MSKRPLNPDEIAAIRKVEEAAAAGMHYDVLGVDPYCTKEEIEAAFRDYVRAWHPDRFYSRDLGELAAVLQDNFVAVTRAQRALAEEGARAKFDRELRESGRMPAPRSQISKIAEASTGHEVLTSRVDGKLSVVSGGARPSSVAPPSPPKPRAPAVIDRIRVQIAEQLQKAREYYAAAQAEAKAGNWAQAESTMYLATRYDPRNLDYQDFYKEVSRKARQVRADQAVMLADQAASYARQKEAVEQLRKAVACDPETGVAFYKLGRALLDYEDDSRGALDMLRKAVVKEPRNTDYRLALSELYDKLGMRQNAQREVRVVLEQDAKHEKAKALAKRIG